MSSATQQPDSASGGQFLNETTTPVEGSAVALVERRNGHLVLTDDADTVLVGHPVEELEFDGDVAWLEVEVATVKRGIGDQRNYVPVTDVVDVEPATSGADPDPSEEGTDEGPAGGSSDGRTTATRSGNPLASPGNDVVVEGGTERDKASSNPFADGNIMAEYLNRRKL